MHRDGAQALIQGCAHVPMTPRSRRVPIGLVSLGAGWQSPLQDDLI